VKIAQLLLLAMIACGLCACGNKGKLKSPTQIQEADAKKKAKAERQGTDDDDDDDSENIAPMHTDVKQSDMPAEEAHSPFSASSPTPTAPDAK